MHAKDEGSKRKDRAAGEDKDAPGLEPAGPVVYGLNNLGNTCFYNSALQVLQPWRQCAKELLSVLCECMQPRGSRSMICTLPPCGQQLKKGPIGSALQELVQTAYGAAH